MRDILPEVVIQMLRDRYLDGVADAEAQFDNGAADEDSLTGALGQAISIARPLSIRVGAQSYTVQVDWRRVRGRGPNAPERLYGPDGLFQMAVFDDRGGILRRKALPFQAKISWNGANSDLLRQSHSLESSISGGLVVDYSPSGYRACTTAAAVAAGGNAIEVQRARAFQSLGKTLANDFLDCTVGSIGMYFDPATERFYNGGNLLQPANAITTVVRRRRAA